MKSNIKTILFALASFLSVEISGMSAVPSSDAATSETVVSEGWTVVRDSARTEFHNDLVIPYSDQGRHIDLFLDGVKGPYEVSVNGIPVGESALPDIQSAFDITPYVRFGEKNNLVITAEALTSKVRIQSSEPVHIAANGTIIRTNWGKVSISTTVVNNDYKALHSSSVAVTYSITGPYGEHVLTSDQKLIELAPSQSGTLTTDLTVFVPFMWDFDARYTYHLLTTVYCGGRIVDQESTPFAFRDLEFHTSRGFLINNRRVLLVGVNVKTDPANLGTVIPEKLWRYRLQKIRDMGFNAVRCTDSPASPEMLSICDEIGLLVIDESMLSGFSNPEMDAFKYLVSRDSNHPSLMLWGIKAPGQLMSDSRGRDLLQILSQRAALIDPMHKTFCANAVGTSLIGGADVNGAAGKDMKAMDTEHSSHLGEFLICTNAAPDQNSWNFFEGKKHLGGFFIDEEKLFDCSSNPLEGAFFIQTKASAKPMVQAIKKSDNQVRVYSNADEVDLVIGNKSLARRRISQSGYADFPLTGEWASITARAYKRGSVICSSKLLKAGPVPVITSSSDKMNADGQDIVVLDVICSQPFDLSFKGPARILGWSNGDASRTGHSLPDEPDRVTVTPMDGHAQVILQSLPGQRGFVNVYVPGLRSPIVISVL